MQQKQQYNNNKQIVLSSAGDARYIGWGHPPPQQTAVCQASSRSEERASSAKRSGAQQAIGHGPQARLGYHTFCDYCKRLLIDSCTNCVIYILFSRCFAVAET